jgi:hypothetical protein
MPQSSTPILVAFLLLAGICRTAAGQAIAEYGLGAGRASTTTAPARNLGKQLGGVLDSLNKVAPAGEGQAAPAVKSSTGSKRSTTSAPAKIKPASKAASTAVPMYEDPRHIEAGIGYEELVRRFGSPSMEVTTRPGGRTLSYATRKGTVAVDVEGEKVVSVATREAPQVTVVLLQ